MVPEPWPPGQERLSPRGPCLRPEERASLYSTAELWVGVGEATYLWIFSAGAGRPEAYRFQGEVFPLEALDWGTSWVRVPSWGFPGEPYALWVRWEDGWYVRCGLFYPYPLRLPPEVEVESERVARWLEERATPPFAVEIGPGVIQGELLPKPQARTPAGWLRVRPLREEEARALRMKSAPHDLETYACWPYRAR